MKRIIIYVSMFITIIIFGYIIFLSVNDMNKPSEESDINGKDISKEEYIYKEELLNLGYSVDEIEIINNKISNIDVKNYLLEKKYDYLLSFISNPYYQISNIERYTLYYEKNPDLSIDEVVLYTEIGLDNEFYTNINIVDNYYDIDCLLNKYNSLPEEIKYDDLVVLNKPYSSDGKIEVRKVIYEDLTRMINDAKKDNINLFVVSGYRSWSKQDSLFKNNKKDNGLSHALMYSSKVGHSEHQLGLAVDFNLAKKSFEKTKQYEWLKQNAYKYGFIERYPKNKEKITGFAYEPWHYRYLGIDASTKIFEENITYEEYLIKYKK